MKLSDFLDTYKLNSIDVVTDPDLLFVPYPSMLYSQYYKKLVRDGANPFSSITDEKFHNIISNITLHVFKNKLGEINPHGKKLYQIKVTPVGHSHNFGEIKITGLFYKGDSKPSFEIHTAEG